jgi:hypothetical protein
MSRVERLAREDRAGNTVILVLGGAFVVGMAVQMAHLFEHAVQMGRWIVQPTVMPWMSPWGHALSGFLADTFAGGRHMPGMELAHLSGNLVFEGAILTGLTLAWVRGRSTVGLRRAAIFQGIHLAEHFSIALSAVAINTPIGMTTLWGALEGGTPTAIAARVLLHFTLNAIATVLAVDAASNAIGSRSRRRERLVARPAPMGPSMQPV